MYLYLGEFDQAMNSANFGLELKPSKDKIDKLTIRKNEALVSLQAIETNLTHPVNID